MYGPPLRCCLAMRHQTHLSDNPVDPVVLIRVQPCLNDFNDTFWPSLCTLIPAASDTSLDYGLEGLNKQALLGACLFKRHHKLCRCKQYQRTPVNTSHQNREGYDSLDSSGSCARVFQLRKAFHVIPTAPTYNTRCCGPT
jgi:hypothetical protein